MIALRALAPAAKYLIPVAGYVLAAVFFWFWHGARENTAEEIERCNRAQLDAVAEAQQAARAAVIESYERQLAEMEEILLREARARQIAEEAATEALSRPERVRTIIKEVRDEHSCLDTAIPDAVLDSLRD